MSTFGSNLSRLFKQVHPDRFGEHPEARAVNESGFQTLNSLLSECKAEDVAAGVRSVAPAEMTFFIRQQEKAEASAGADAGAGAGAEGDHESLVQIQAGLAAPDSDAGGAGRALRATFASLFEQAGLDPRFEWGDYFGGPVDESKPQPSMASVASLGSSAHAHVRRRGQRRPERQYPAGTLMAFLGEALVGEARAVLSRVKDVERERDIVQASLAFNGVRVLYDDGRGDVADPGAKLEWLNELKAVVNAVYDDVEIPDVAVRSSSGGCSGGGSEDDMAVPRERPAVSPAFDPRVLGSAASRGSGKTARLVVYFHRSQAGMPPAQVDELGRLHLGTGAGDRAGWTAAVRAFRDSPAAQRVGATSTRTASEQSAGIALASGMHVRHVFASSTVEAMPEYGALIRRLEDAVASGAFRLDWLETGKLASLPLQIVAHSEAAYIDTENDILCVPVESSVEDIVQALRRNGRRVVRSRAAAAAGRERVDTLLKETRRHLLLERLTIAPEVDPKDAVGCLQRLNGASALLGPKLVGLRVCVGQANEWDPVSGTLEIDHHFELGL